MRTPRRYTAALGIIAICVLSLSTTPAFADTASTSPGQTLGLDYSSGDKLGDVIQRAVDSEGSEAVSQQLQALAAAAKAGKEIHFPGLDGLAPAVVGSDLSSIAAALSNGQDLPVSIAALIVQPTAVLTPQRSGSYRRQSSSCHLGSSNQRLGHLYGKYGCRWRQGERRSCMDNHRVDDA